MLLCVYNIISGSCKLLIWPYWPFCMMSDLLENDVFDISMFWHGKNKWIMNAVGIDVKLVMNASEICYKIIDFPIWSLLYSVIYIHFNFCLFSKPMHTKMNLQENWTLKENVIPTGFRRTDAYFLHWNKTSLSFPLCFE